MKHQVSAIAISTLFALALTGCSNVQAPTEPTETDDSVTITEDAGAEAQSTAPVETGGTSSLFSNDGWPENDVTAAVPVPQISVPATSLTQSDESITITYENVPEAEVEAFIQEVKDAGFTFNVLESSMTTLYSYDADNSEDIFTKTGINIQYNSEGKLYISVHHIVD